MTGHACAPDASPPLWAPSDTGLATVDSATRVLLVLCDPGLWNCPREAARRLAEWGPAHGENALALASRHRVLPLFAHSLGRLPPLPNTPFSPEMLHGITSKARLSEMAQLATLVAIQGAMAQAGVRVVLLKGLAVSARAYGTLGMRTNRDLDLWTSPDQIPAARAALETLGYVMVEPAAGLSAADLAVFMRRSKDLVFCHPAHHQIVELHHRLFDNEAFNFPGFFERTVPLALPGGVEVLALHPQDELRYLALHGAMHGWSRLKWLVDLVWLARRQNAIQIEELLARSAGHPAYIALQTALALSQRLFVDTPAFRASAPSRRARALATICHKVMLDHGAMEIEQTRYATSLKNLGIYLLVTRWRTLVQRLTFDLLASPDKSRGATCHPLVAAMRRIPSWAFRHLSEKQS